MSKREIRTKKNSCKFGENICLLARCVNDIEGWHLINISLFLNFINRYCELIPKTCRLDKEFNGKWRLNGYFIFENKDKVPSLILNFPQYLKYDFFYSINQNFCTIKLFETFFLCHGKV